MSNIVQKLSIVPKNSNKFRFFDSVGPFWRIQMIVMKNRLFVVLSGQCSRHCRHVSGQRPLLVGRQKRFVSGSTCEMFPTCRVNSLITLKFSNFLIFYSF